MGMRDVCLQSYSEQARNYFIACYAVSLFQGQTINGKLIKLATVRQYLKEVYALFEARKCKWHSDDDYIKLVLDSVKSYESVPRRRHMITDGMMHWMIAQANHSGIDSSTAAIVDWTILGRYTGFRKSEFCQSSQHSYTRIDDWPHRPPLAFIEDDFTFLGSIEQIISTTTLSDFDAILKHVHYVRIRWRKQKNNQNGEEITFARDDDKPNVCPVRAAIRIILRAHRLGVKTYEPIGVSSSNAKRQYITDTRIAALYRKAASVVLRISSKGKDIKQWSTHSLRVTAANLLYREKHTDSFIQKRLRWRSNTFLDYLRNTIYAATEHSKALTISPNNLPSPLLRSYRESDPVEEMLEAAGAA